MCGKDDFFIDLGNETFVRASSITAVYNAFAETEEGGRTYFSKVVAGGQVFYPNISTKQVMDKLRTFQV